MNETSQVPNTGAASPRRPGDALASTWVDRAPPPLQPYLRLMRFDRPIGFWLLFWPCVFGLVLGAAADGRAFPDPVFIVLMGIGSIVMRGAGCTYNDIIDRDIDAQVARTRGRPLPSGAVTVKAAWVFALLLSLVGFAILLAFNRFTILLGVSSLVLVAGYPFMKRLTWWPQAWLGLTFNWGVLLGFAAETGGLGPAALIFYAACFFWTLGYDTIYALQDKEDDALIGVKSSARRFGLRTKPWLYGLYGAAYLLFLLSGLAAGLGLTYALGLIIVGAHLLWQLIALEAGQPLLCLKLFRANRDTGALIAAALILGSLTAP